MFLNKKGEKGLIPLLLILFCACDSLFKPNDFQPTGSPFSLNSNITVLGIAGSRSKFSPNGLFTLEMVCKSTGTAKVFDTLPGGLLFTSKTNATQHVIVLKEHRIGVDTAKTALVIGVFCCNRYRQIPAEKDSFLLGPFTDNPELRQVAELVRNKKISDNLGLVQRAVWMITDSTGLTQAYIDSLNALPPEGDGYPN